MALPVEQLSYRPNGASTNRNLDTVNAQNCVNVRDFGAVGDGTTNDTAAVQTAINAAFGSSASPHGAANTHLNKPLYFPAGTYLVRNPVAAKTVTDISVVTPGPGQLTYTVASTTGLTNGMTVYIVGCNGDGYINGTRKITNVTGTTFQTVNDNLYCNSYTDDDAGRIYVPALLGTHLTGCLIFGDGKESSTIYNDENGGICLLLDGIRQTVIERMNFQCQNLSTNSVNLICDLDAPSDTVSGSQGNHYRDVGFTYGAVGCELFPTNASQGSENLFVNCHFQQNTGAGLINGRNFNQNALQQTVIGGNFQTCGTGILVPYGSIALIEGAGFQESTNYDIQNYNGADDCMYIANCRSESQNFAYVQNQVPTLINISHLNLSNGILLLSDRGGTVIGCVSTRGQLDLQVGGSVIGSQFGRLPSAWLVQRAVPVYVEQCQIGQVGWGGFPDSFSIQANYLKGMFYASGGTLYFIGKKFAMTSTGSSPLTTTNMMVGDLPAASVLKGEYVTVYDATATTIASTVAGGGSNCVMVFSNGTNWKIAAS